MWATNGPIILFEEKRKYTGRHVVASRTLFSCLVLVTAFTKRQTHEKLDGWKYVSLASLTDVSEIGFMKTAFAVESGRDFLIGSFQFNVQASVPVERTQWWCVSFSGRKDKDCKDSLSNQACRSSSCFSETSMLSLNLSRRISKRNDRDYC